MLETANDRKSDGNHTRTDSPKLAHNKGGATDTDKESNHSQARCSVCQSNHTRRNGTAQENNAHGNARTPFVAKGTENKAHQNRSRHGGNRRRPNFLRGQVQRYLNL